MAPSHHAVTTRTRRRAYPEHSESDPGAGSTLGSRVGIVCAAVDDGVGALLGHRAGMTHGIRDGQMPKGLERRGQRCRVRATQRWPTAPEPRPTVRATISAAGSARAIAADWPAQACMRWTSPAFCAAARIAAVRPRCTGIGRRLRRVRRRGGADVVGRDAAAGAAAEGAADHVSSGAVRASASAQAGGSSPRGSAGNRCRSARRWRRASAPPRRRAHRRCRPSRPPGRAPRRPPPAPTQTTRPVVASAWAASKQPRWPPASMPWATMTSAPALPRRAPRRPSRRWRTRRCRAAFRRATNSGGKRPITDETIGGAAASKASHCAAKSGGVASPASGGTGRAPVRRGIRAPAPRAPGRARGGRIGDPQIELERRRCCPARTSLGPGGDLCRLHQQRAARAEAAGIGDRDRQRRRRWRRPSAPAGSAPAGRTGGRMRRHDRRCLSCPTVLP